MSSGLGNASVSLVMLTPMSAGELSSKPSAAISSAIWRISSSVRRRRSSAMSGM
jgi:hypothetical protein